MEFSNKIKFEDGNENKHTEKSLLSTFSSDKRETYCKDIRRKQNDWLTDNNMCIKMLSFENKLILETYFSCLSFLYNDLYIYYTCILKLHAYYLSLHLHPHPISVQCLYLNLFDVVMLRNFCDLSIEIWAISWCI